MVDQAGKQLARARQSRGISLDEAALATKVRKEKLHALETGDLGQFPSVAYAKSFYHIYARYLGVDLQGFLHSLDSYLPITLDTYGYLNNQIDHHEERSLSPAMHAVTGADRRNAVPILALTGLLVAGWLGFSFVMNYGRIGGNLQQLAERNGKGATTPVLASIVSPVVNEPAAPQPSPAPPETPAIISTEKNPDAAPMIATPGDYPLPAEPVVEARDHVVTFEPTKKTWITVRQDDPASEPVFEDYLYPGAGTLRVLGQKLFVAIRDPDAVEIRKNGALLPANSQLTIQ